MIWRTPKNKPKEEKQMNIFKNKKVAIAITLVAIMLSSLYGISKKPAENLTYNPQPVNTHNSEQYETPTVSEGPVLDKGYESESTNPNEEFDLRGFQHSIPLTDIDYFTKAGAIHENSWIDSTDNYGATYPHSIAPYDSGTTYIEYYLGGQYAKLTGVLYITSHAKSISPSYYTWNNATISIYGDDVLLYTKTGFTTKDQPIDISVDISEVDFLKISFENAHYFDTGMSESLIGLGNPTVGW